MGVVPEESESGIVEISPESPDQSFSSIARLTRNIKNEKNRTKWSTKKKWILICSSFFILSVVLSSSIFMFNFLQQRETTKCSTGSNCFELYTQIIEAINDQQKDDRITIVTNTVFKRRENKDTVHFVGKVYEKIQR